MEDRALGSQQGPIRLVDGLRVPRLAQARRGMVLSG
jgi:hypothetical protein